MKSWYGLRKWVIQVFAAWPSRVLLSLAILTLVVELILRLGFGFGQPVLYVVDAETGYRMKPNQQIVRRGNQIYYNAYSQRSAPFAQPKPAGLWRILMTGDSILNGGSVVDQRQTISELFRAGLQQRGLTAEVLNASAGSWGIGNAYAYVKKFGLFDSDIVIIEVGTNDLTQKNAVSASVGRDPNKPDRPPLLAMQEIFSRSIQPWVRRKLARFTRPSDRTNTGNANERVLSEREQAMANQQQLAEMIQWVRDRQRPVFVLLVPELTNLTVTPQSPLFPLPYGPEFYDLLRQHQVPLVDILKFWRTLPLETIYRFYQKDGVHLTAEANASIAAALLRELCTPDHWAACVSAGAKNKLN